MKVKMEKTNQKKVIKLYKQGYVPKDIVRALEINRGSVDYWIEKEKKKKLYDKLYTKYKNSSEYKLKKIDKELYSRDYPENKLMEDMLRAKAKFYLARDMINDLYRELF